MTRLGDHQVQPLAVCASIIGKELDSMENSLETAVERGADVVELRLDMLGETCGWRGLIRDDIPNIVTVRSGDEGGYFDGSEEDRIGLLLDAIDAGASCVDVELSTSEEMIERVLEAADDGGASVILSFHDFEGVPPLGELEGKVDKMKELGCDIAKVIGFADGPQDALDMLDFLIRVTEGADLPVIAFAMGEKGDFTRVAAPLLGSPITYASVGEGAAPGQLGLAETKRILDRFSY